MVQISSYPSNDDATAWRYHDMEARKCGWVIAWRRGGAAVRCGGGAEGRRRVGAEGRRGGVRVLVILIKAREFFLGRALRFLKILVLIQISGWSAMGRIGAGCPRMP